MKITIIGGSGRTGLQVGARALAAGHSVTAAVRTPSKVTLDPHPDLEVVATDMFDPAALSAQVTGRDAVVFCLGHNDRKPSSIIRDSMEATIWAMEHSGTRRLLAVSASGFVRDRNDGPILRHIAKPLVGRILKSNFDDLKAMEGEVVASELDWTIVSPPRLTDTPFDGKYRVSVDLTVPGGSTVSRANLADYLLAAAEDRSTIQHRMFIAR